MKRFIDSRWAWDSIQGFFYNRLIYKAASDLYQKFISEIRPRENTKILDVGAGPGFVTMRLAKENPTVSVTGIDFSPTEVRAANRLCSNSKITNCSFRHGNVMNLDFNDHTFDIVISIASLKHWPDGKKAMQEISRVLRDDGFAFITEADASASDKEILRFAQRFDAWYVYKPFIRWYVRKGVVGQSYTNEEAGTLARQAGFSRVSVEKLSGWPFFFMKLEK